MMLEILKKMFEAKPEISTIALKKICSDCGCEVNIDITPASGGYGLQGGALFECSTDDYCAKCAACYKANQNSNRKKVK
ncbi:MAG: hypothetical protein JRE07_05765 [Deltaproteobacteria bacterium]|nr:hypothetical protein [Deltaproteobacteria bacterium]